MAGGRVNGARLRAKVAHEAAARIKLVAGPKQRGENTKARMMRTTELLGWTYSRVHDVWYKIARRIDAHEMDQLRALTGQIHRLSTPKPLENSNSG
jgi:hypothetical protein